MLSIIVIALGNHQRPTLPRLLNSPLFPVDRHLSPVGIAQFLHEFPFSRSRLKLRIGGNATKLKFSFEFIFARVCNICRFNFQEFPFYIYIFFPPRTVIGIVFCVSCVKKKKSKKSMGVSSYNFDDESFK